MECDSDFLPKLNLAPAYTVQVKKKLNTILFKPLQELSVKEVDLLLRSLCYHDKVDWTKHAHGISGYLLQYSQSVRDFFVYDISANESETLGAMMQEFRLKGVPTRLLLQEMKPMTHLFKCKQEKHEAKITSGKQPPLSSPSAVDEGTIGTTSAPRGRGRPPRKVKVQPTTELDSQGTMESELVDEREKTTVCRKPTAPAPSVAVNVVGKKRSATSAELSQQSFDAHCSALVDGTDRTAVIKAIKYMLTHFPAKIGSTKPQELIDYGVAEAVFTLARDSRDEEVETSTIWLLANLLGGRYNESMHTHVISLGLCVLVLSKLRAPRSGLVKENTLWLAMNTCSAKYFRDALVDGGIIELLVKGHDPSDSVEMHHVTLRVMFNLLVEAPLPVLTTLRPLLGIVTFNLREGSPLRCTVEALEILNFFTVQDDDSSETARIDAVFEEGVMSRVMELVRSSYVSVACAAQRVVENCTAGSKTRAGQLVDMGLLPLLEENMHNERPLTVLTASRTLCNLCGCGSESILSSVLETEIFPSLLGLCTAEGGVRDDRLLQTAVFALSNAAAVADGSQVAELVSAGAVSVLCSVLVAFGSGNEDAEAALLKAISALTDILRKSNTLIQLDLIIRKVHEHNCWQILDELRDDQSDRVGHAVKGLDIRRFREGLLLSK